MSRAAMTSKLTQAMIESLVYRWNGVKAFAGNGNYFMQNRVVDAGFRSLPFYMMDLTSCVNFSNGVTLHSPPFVQLGSRETDGAMCFKSQTTSTPLGATVGVVPFWGIERAPTFLPVAALPAVDAGSAPLGKSILQWASIQLNLWGCTQKSTKYAVELVQFLDEDLCPVMPVATAIVSVPFSTEVASASIDRTAFYQNIVKSWTYNPISTTTGLTSRRMRTLKSQTFTIAPNPTTDGDVDPQCRNVKMFVKLNKVCDYSQIPSVLTAGNLLDDSDYAVTTGTQITPVLQPKQRVYLIIRATNYGSDGAADLNTVTPSFDLSVRVKHAIAQ